MEGVINSTTHGVNLVRSDAPSNYHVPQRIPENPSQTVAVLPHLGVAPPPSTTVVTGHVPGPISGPMGGSMISLMKKKRGRPRKYAADGSGPVAGALSPKPISSAPPPPPPVIDFSIEKPPTKIRSIPKQYQPRIETESLVPSGDWVSTSVCANFSPHIITVNAGEDVTMKVISFSQQGPRAVCILSANGVISNVTLRQPDSSGGTLTYEGRFEILSLTGSFMPTETGGMRNRSGGMSVSLASPDGRVVGGGVAGLLVAASPIQIVVGSFLAGNQHEQKTKKPKTDSLPVTAVAPIPLSSPDGPTDESHRWSSLPTSDSMNRTNENNASLP